MKKNTTFYLLSESADSFAFHENHIHADPKFPIIFHTDRVCSASPCNSFHWHEGLELLCFLEGSATVFSDELRIPVSAGEIAVINSNHLHAVYSPSPGCRYYCLIADREFCDSFGLPISRLNFMPSVHDHQLTESFSRINSEMKDGLPFGSAAVKSEVLQLLVRLCRGFLASAPASSIGADPSRHRFDMVKHTIRFIAQNYARALTLDDICSATGFSKYYLCRTFREATGQTIIDYLNLQRCRSARTMLSSGDCTVSECAEACGYNSPSYFARQYKKYIGELPSAQKER